MNFLNFEIIAAILFVLFLLVFILIKRKNITVQKILYPLLYLVLYKSNFGIKFINKTAQKHKELIKFFGYSCIGLAVFGMIYISINVIAMIYTLIVKPAAVPGVALVLPFTHIPGIGYLSFFHWIIAIFILAIVHEFGHGIVARAHGLKIKSSGFAFFGVLLPIIPAAFVEPDEEKLIKTKDTTQYSVFAAGPLINILLAIALLIAFPYVANPAKLAPFEEKLTMPIGFSFELTNQTLPAAQAGLESGMILTSFNNQTITDATKFLETMYYCVKPGQTIALGTTNKTYTLTTVDDGTGRGIIGVTKFKNERRIKPAYASIKHLFFWTKDLIRWVFLLNLFIGLFNLLPLGIVDGGRMLNIFLQRTIKSKKKARKIWGFISAFFLLLIVLGLASTYIMPLLK